MNTRTAMLDFAVDTNERPLCRTRRPARSSTLTRSGISRSPSIVPASKSGRRSSTKRPAKGLRITARPMARTIGRECGHSKLRENNLAARGDFTNFDHLDPSFLVLSYPR